MFTSKKKCGKFQLVEPLPDLEHSKLMDLRQILRDLKKVCVAYSGGVDSSLVAAIAYEQLGKEAFAATGVSPSLAPSLLNEARAQAAWIGIRHKECLTNELLNPGYNQNPANRCFACKSELHLNLKNISNQAEKYQVVDGVNIDDHNDYRPGIEAAKLAGVISPLAELHIKKDSIRRISKSLGFRWWNKPAQPCLASRFPYGEYISTKKLRQVDEAEAFLKSLGFKELRVRYHQSNAKIEVEPTQIDDLKLAIKENYFIDKFKSIGFQTITIDEEGFVSGKLNRSIKIDHIN